MGELIKIILFTILVVCYGFLLYYAGRIDLLGSIMSKLQKYVDSANNEETDESEDKK